MGNYTEISISVELETEEQAKRLEIIGKGFARYMIERRAKQGKNDDFSVCIDNVEIDDCNVDLLLSSGREENAEWQAEQLFEICKEEFGKDLISFSAEMNVPTNIIYFNREDEE
jgi:hypothetical protein